ncbi:MAG TPA: class I SAM-dependent methyltransferase [Streptosporangiaceae bacterium]|nr:class I SAM-dependent methyltransferase [Streptosporangiaceae bacterium]
MAARPDRREGRVLYGVDPPAYDAGRPEYPDRVYELLAARGGLGPGCRVVEIGPGTGLVTRHLLAAGGQVTAVEANEQMTSYLRANITAPGLEVITGAFEDARLPRGAFDLAVAATSFHWVSQPAGWDKLRQILRPGGWVAVWWMLFEDPASPDEFTRAAEQVLGGSPNYTEPGRLPFQVDLPARQADLADAGFTEVQAELVHSAARLGAAQVRALYATLAIVLRRPAAEQAAALDGLEHLVAEEFGGHVERQFVTAVYLGRNP